MMMAGAALFAIINILFLHISFGTTVKERKLPLIVSTWGNKDFQAAAQRSPFDRIKSSPSHRLLALVEGLTECENRQCDTTVGYGGSPDEDGETTLAEDMDRSFSKNSHDTIGMIIIDKNKDVSVGTSTNGARNKIAGRVGDSALPGAGGYVDNLVGGASATGDGDIMMRFLPSFLAVEKMRSGASPKKAAEIAIMRIKEHYPNFFGAVVCGNIKGEHGAACNGMPIFQYTAGNGGEKNVKVYNVKCF
uniref:N(4)-(Beta-N-acetylglucosaminyl)-L-asparaginase n=1 Tax=Panagrolaimus sp. ES5 TaxID=591445 RepID=A0AC34FC53_9BILA